MAYPSSQVDVVSGEQYRYALTNFRLAHEKVEQQRAQLEEQEKQVALLRARIALLEGGEQIKSIGGNSVDDFSIKIAASQLERDINVWAADIVRTPPVPLDHIYNAILVDIMNESDSAAQDALPMIVQSYLRHALSEVISEAIINCLVITKSPEANTHLTRIHEHLFSRDPTVACVWRRQTFSAAIDTCPPELAQAMFLEHIPILLDVLHHGDEEHTHVSAGYAIIESAFAFSRLLHGAQMTSGSTSDAFYRAFVPDVASPLYPQQIELIKRCTCTARGEPCKIGATVFPGLVKVTRGPTTLSGEVAANVQTVVRRARAVCACALAYASASTGQG